MKTFQDIFTYQLFQISNQAITLAHLFLIPVVLWLIYLFIKKSSRLLNKALNARNFNADVVLLIQRLYFIVILAIVIITGLGILGIPLAAFAFVSGAIAIGVGFGAQNIINNFISGWILMWEKPIRIGDFLEIGEVRGTVDTINTRSTRIRRIDGVHLLIPNSQLLENMVVNWTLVDRMVRTTITVGVAYGSPVRKVADLIMQAAVEEPEVLSEEKAPKVIFEDFGDSALIFDVYVWIDSFGDTDLRTLRSNIRFRITELFEANDIVIAFPQRDVHIDGQVRLVRPPKKNESPAADS
tara:strand:+ start:1541 stop:2431 length:891 start_codon:yes stop_codon:yes gene_type:complete